MFAAPGQLMLASGDAWPQDVQQRSYLPSGGCGPGTDVACPDPRVPFPRGTSSLHIAPDGTLVTPQGTNPITAPTQSTTP
jgi:hypothetical protein